MTDVFFQGYGRWCGYYAPYPDSIFETPDYHQEDYSHYTGVFKLPENSEKRYEYTQEIVALTLRPNISHKDRANFPCEDILNYVVPESRKIPELANFFKMALFGTLWFEIDQDREYILIPIPEKIESTETISIQHNTNQTVLFPINSNADYISDKLNALYLAAQKYWQNADPNDSTTHPIITKAQLQSKKIKRQTETQNMYAKWHEAYETLASQNPNRSNAWIAKTIAKMDIAQGRNSETIRKNMGAKK